MKTLLKIFMLIFCFDCSSAPTLKQEVMPKNLNESILYLEHDWRADELNLFKNMPEDKAVADAHTQTGLWIRNTWIRGNRNVALVDYFSSIGIKNPDDISSIILTSLHRKLNNKKIDIAKQVGSYKAYWKTINECEEKTRETALKNYNRFKIGDRVSIYMPVDHTEGSRNGIIYMCPDVSWKFDPKTDLLIEGMVVKKYNINSPSNVFFTVQIKSLNRKDTDVLMKQVKIGEEMSFSLNGLTIK